MVRFVYILELLSSDRLLIPPSRKNFPRALLLPEVLNQDGLQHSEASDRQLQVGPDPGPELLEDVVGLRSEDPAAGSDVQNPGRRQRGLQGDLT